jgi:hypothetical protein
MPSDHGSGTVWTSIYDKVRGHYCRKQPSLAGRSTLNPVSPTNSPAPPHRAYSGLASNRIEHSVRKRWAEPVMQFTHAVNSSGHTGSTTDRSR